MMADSGSFAEMFDGKFSTPREFTPGEQVEAKVVRISGNNVFLDVGGKSEGYVAREELLDKQGELTVREGEKIRFISCRPSVARCSSPPGWAAGVGPAKPIWRRPLQLGSLSRAPSRRRSKAASR
jgi:hypothetical protein